MTTFTGSNGSDNIISDADVIFARKGDDVVHATHAARATGDAAVTVYGGEGNDLLLYEGVPAGAAVLFGGDGADTLQGGSGGDFLSGDRGHDLLYGGDGRDDLAGGSGNDTLVGGAVADFLGGGAGEDVLDGGDGFDRLDGGAGMDTLIGGLGDDNLLGGAAADRLEGGPGSDTADYRTSTGPFRADLSNPSTNTGDAQGDSYSSVENLSGGIYADVLKGDNGDNILRGSLGNDLLIGLGGSDHLLGQEGNDTLQGQGGHDTLNGATGDDVLTGGASGRDVFAFYFDFFGSFDGSFGHDVITDFEDGADLIHLVDQVEIEEDHEVFNPIRFEDLVITQQGADTLIVHKLDPASSILLLNESASNITGADFDFTLF